MHVEEVTLTVDRKSYTGRLNTPEESTERGVLIVPGAGHGPYGDVFDRFAEAATETGHEVARFETWSSRDELDAKTEEDFRDELHAGIEFLRSRDCTTVTVVAKSFGGRLTLDYATERADRMVLWAPAILFGDHEDAPSISADEAKEIDIPALVLQGDEDEVVSLENAANIAEHLPDGGLVELPGEDHGFQTSQQQIVEETIAFLPE